MLMFSNFKWITLIYECRKRAVVISRKLAIGHGRRLSPVAIFDNKKQLNLLIFTAVNHL